MSIFQELIKWYDLNCDGEWEHGNGINIQTLDNPGWLIQITSDKFVKYSINIESSKNVSELLIKQAKGEIQTPFIAESPNDLNDWFSIITQNNKIIIACTSNNVEDCLKYVLSKL